MARIRTLYLGDPHGDIDNIVAALSSAGSVDEVISLGDLHAGTFNSFTSDLTAKDALAGTRVRMALRDDVGLRSAVEQGHYTRAQLDRFLNATQTAQSAADSLARVQLEKILSVTGDNFSTIGGNWDLEAPMQEVLGDAYKDGEVTTEHGIRTAWLSGGGSAPAGHAGFVEGFLADSPEEDIHRIAQAREALLTPPENGDTSLDRIITHIPFPTGGQHTDQYALQLRALLFARYEAGLELPKVLVNGHHHGAFSFSWDTLEDPNNHREATIARFAPGVLTTSNSQGSYGTFCVAETETETGLIEAVDEYRLHKRFDGEIRVELYARHTIDHEAQEVHTDTLGEEKGVFNPGRFEHNDENVDAGYKALSASLAFDKEGLDKAALDYRLKESFVRAEALADEFREGVASAVRDVHMKYVHSFSSDHVFSATEELHAHTLIMERLIEFAGEAYGVELSTDPSQGTKYAWSVALVRSVLGVDMSTIAQSASLAHTPAGSVGYQWGRDNREGLDAKAYGGVVNKAHRIILDSVDADDFLSLVETFYAPQHVARKQAAQVDKIQAASLWWQARNNGLLREGELVGSGLYAVDESFAGEGISGDDLDTMLGVTRERESERYFSPRETVDFADIDNEGIRGQLANGGAVYSDSQGDYILVSDPQGRNVSAAYLPEDLDIAYEATPLAELLAQGGAQFVRSGDAYGILDLEGRSYSIDPEAEGLERSSAVPLGIAQHNLASQREMFDLARMLQARGADLGDTAQGLGGTGAGLGSDPGNQFGYDTSDVDPASL